MTISLDNYRAFGDVTFDFWESELRRVNSPLYGWAIALYEAVTGYSALALAHMWRESQYETDRLSLSPFDYNPFNLRPNGREKPSGMTGIKADYLTFDSPVSCAKEWRRRVIDDPTYKGGVYTGVSTLADYIQTYAPDWDTHPVTGENNSSYYRDMVTILTRFIDKGQEPALASHRFILSAGHRNTDGGGASNEINWTYPSVLALKQAIQKRGGKAWIVSEEDGDNDPSFSKGRGLQAAAGLCVSLAAKHGPFDAYISSHYNGGNSPGFHAIFPDARSGSDTKANNPLDVQLCRAIRDRVRDTETVKMLSWTGDSPGVMSEKETGVGAQGYRLGEFVGTLGFRDTTARVIIEASSIDVASERKFINDPKWVRDVYCEAIVDALEDVFGKFKQRPDTKPEPKPSTFPSKSPIPELSELPAYHQVFASDGKRIAQMVRTDYTVRINKDTPALRYATPSSERVSNDFIKGALVDVEYLIINADNTTYWYTADGVRFDFSAADPYFADVDEAAA